MYFYFRKRKGLNVSRKGLLRENIFPYPCRKTTHRPEETLQKRFQKLA